MLRRSVLADICRLKSKPSSGGPSPKLPLSVTCAKFPLRKLSLILRSVHEITPASSAICIHSDCKVHGETWKNEGWTGQPPTILVTYVGLPRRQSRCHHLSRCGRAGGRRLIEAFCNPMLAKCNH